jgi:hypothetical protein
MGVMGVMGIMGIMVKRWMTRWVVLGAIGVLVAWEGITFSGAAEPGCTISEMVWAFCGQGAHVFVVFAVGILCGHLFWQRQKETR